MKINNSFCKLLLLTSLLLFQSFNLYSQWSTQTVELKLGWNGVYLHVDASHENISELEDLDPNITDIWLWNPKLKSDQFIQNPDVPTDTKSRWIRWNKDLGPSSALQRLVGNSAYLVRYGEKNEDGSWVPKYSPESNESIESIAVTRSDDGNTFSWSNDTGNLFNLVGVDASGTEVNLAYSVSSPHTQIGVANTFVAFKAYSSWQKWDNESSQFTGASWSIKGTPVPPNYSWTSTGLNFIGFSKNPNSITTFERFFLPELLNGEPAAQFFTYKGGELSDSEGAENPDEVIAKRNSAIKRGEALWMRVGDTFNNYFGPFDVVLQNNSGAHFGESTERYRIVIRNMFDEALGVTMSLRPTETPPQGQPEIKSGLKVLVRGNPNPIDLSYDYTRLDENSPMIFTLSARKANTIASETSQEIIIGIDRNSMEGNPGDLYGGVLEFKDSLGMLLYEIPITCKMPTDSGLWVGTANVDQVRHDISFFRETEDGGVVEEDGKAVYDGINQTYGNVSDSYPLRYIFHRQNGDNDSTTRLYQRVFFGLRKGAEVSNDFILTNNEKALDSKFLDSARRIASAHLPWSKSNDGWECSGNFKRGEVMVVKVKTAYNDRISNPFIHAYHPDHDNLDAKFERELTSGYESWGINREMSFRFDAPRDTFDSLVSIGRRIEGEYHEQVDITGMGVEKKSYYSKGTFTLNRLHESNAIVPWDGVDDSEEGEVPEQSEEEIVENDGEPTSEDDDVEEGDGNP